MLSSLMITFQSDGSGSHFKKKLLDCKIGKRLSLQKGLHTFQEAEKAYNDKFSRVNALFLSFAPERMIYFFIFHLVFYPYTNSINIT